MLFLLLFFMSTAFADATYNWQNPTYIPTAQSPPATYSAPADPVITTQNLSVVTIRISGTCTGLVAVPQGTNEQVSPNWTALYATPVDSGGTLKSITASGFYRVNSAGFSQVRLHITALTASCTVTLAGTSGSVYAGYSDVCLSPNLTHSGVAIAQATATTAQLVALTAGQTIAVCGFSLTAGGTSPAFKFVDGGGTACATDQTSLTGSYAPSATIGVVNYSPNATAFSARVGMALCLTTAATTDVEGVLTYVKW